MKRSEINAILTWAEGFIREQGFALPPFARFSPELWRRLGPEWDEVRDLQLGWDVTDYGLGRFSEVGLTLFTLRNGSLTDPRYPKAYAEKLLLSQPGQVCPNHFHFRKREDIICRGGGPLRMQLWPSLPDGGVGRTGTVSVVSDGCLLTLAAGETLLLQPGQSVTLTPGVYHAFWAEGSPCLVGEVSSVNDDHTDNRFAEPMGRFPAIQEDEAPLYLLCTEYGG